MNLFLEEIVITAEMRCMTGKSTFLTARFIILTFSAGLLFSVNIFAQLNGPDEQIKREMIAFVRKSTKTFDLSETKIVQPAALTDSANANSADSETNKAEDFGEKKKFAALERKAFDLLNERRLANGLLPLKWSDEIAKIARLHSQNMARTQFFSHREADGSMVNDRADALGISDWDSIGENIAYNRGFKLPADSACEQWMLSPGHRDNILNAKWKETGIGVAMDSNGTYYFTQVFILR